MSVDEAGNNSELAQTIAQVIRKLKADGKETEFTESIRETLEKALHTSADALFETLKHDAPIMLAEHIMLRTEFEARLYEWWGPALDIFETTLVIAQEAGDNFRARHQERASQEMDLVFAVLLRLHARACQTASEVLALLRSGYATAAMARWRTIHELAVVMTLINDHGQDLANRYIDHDVVEAAHDAREYQQHHKTLGYEPYTSVELAGIQRRSDEVLKKYELEPNFRYRHGWAAKAIGITKPTFEQLEQAAKLGHMRPSYSMASHGVHSQSRGILFQLGQIGPERAILAGASNAGLADPGHSTLISLLQCTAVFLCIAPDVDAAMILPAMQRFVNEAGGTFLKIHKTLVREEEELQSSPEVDGQSDS